MRFTPGDVLNPRFSHVFILARGNNILSLANTLGEPFSVDALPLENPDLKRAHYIGDYADQHCFVLQVKEDEISLSEDLQWSPLRQLLDIVSDSHFQMLSRALQITRWFREHRFCGICGQTTDAASNERVLICRHCDHRYYPRISPCVICLVTRGNQCLLAHHAHHPEGVFTTLAGFIELGETAEQAVKREIMEEVNLEVKNLRYFRSQAWPFPGQLMLGFTAEYASGELEPDGHEILEAAWFKVEDLPSVPPASTISAQLINSFVEHERNPSI